MTKVVLLRPYKRHSSGILVFRWDLGSTCMQCLSANVHTTMVCSDWLVILNNLCPPYKQFGRPRMLWNRAQLLATSRVSKRVHSNDTKLTTMSKRVIGRRNEQLNLLISNNNIMDVSLGPPEVPVAQMLLDQNAEGYKFVIWRRVEISSNFCLMTILTLLLTLRPSWRVPGP